MPIVLIVFIAILQSPSTSGHAAALPTCGAIPVRGPLRRRPANFQVYTQASGQAKQRDKESSLATRTLGRPQDERATQWRWNANLMGLKAVLAVADDYRELIGLLRLAGAPLASIQISANKVCTSARERKPSRAVGEASRDAVNCCEMAYFGDPRFTGWGGGFLFSSAGSAPERSP
ncbi:MAG: heme-binding protein [Roseiarcus sp.]|jgi:hypothetical protein